MCFNKNKQSNNEKIKNNEYFLDSPIKINNENDELWTEKIIKQIESIIEVVDVSEESYVIGLQWAWWSWKSSILKSLNFNENDYIVFNYSPRIYGNEVNLYEKFFDELAKYIWSNKFCSDKSIKKDFMEYKLKIIWKFADKFNNFWISLFKIIYKLFLNWSIVYLLYTLQDVLWFKKIFYIIWLFFIIASIVYVWLLIKMIINKYNLWRYYKNYTTIDEVKNTISRKLFKLNKKVIIIIDDIDRLKSDKISSIFQLVKSTANFNNVIYLLSYDKYIVCEALKKEYQVDWYLDKFIQMEISLPKYPMFWLNNIFSEYINQFLEYVQEKYPDTNYKLSEIERNEIKNFMLSPKFSDHFKTIRDVKRYINMLKADFNILHQNQRINEINILDLIFIEIIKFSDKKFYSWIYETMGSVIYTRLIRWRYIEDIKTSIMATINQDYIWWEDLFIYLFPLTTNWVNVSDSSRIGSIYSFNIYYSLITPSISNTQFYEILNSIYNSNKDRALNYINEDYNIRDFIRKVQDKAKNLDYNNDKEKELFAELLIFVINNEKNFKKYTDFLQDLNTDIGKCLFLFLDNLKSIPTDYKKYFMKIFNWSNEYYQIISYVFNYLNKDYKYLYQNENKYIVDQFKQDHDSLWNKIVIQLQNSVQEKYLELLWNNKLHLMWNWFYSIEIAILLKWIKNKSIIYKYLKDNSLFSEFLVKAILQTTSNYFEWRIWEHHVKNYLAHAKLYFNKKQFSTAIKLFDWNDNDKKALQTVLKIWK